MRTRRTSSSRSWTVPNERNAVQATLISEHAMAAEAFREDVYVSQPRGVTQDLFCHRPRLRVPGSRQSSFSGLQSPWATTTAVRGIKMRIAVLFGGTSEERDVSVASGAQAVQALEAAGHDVIAVELHDIFDYASKYQPDGAEEIFPANLPPETTSLVRLLGLEAHRAVKAGSYSRVDFRLDESGQVWCLELNTVPGMTRTSLLPQSAQAAGITFSELCDRICRAAVAGHRRTVR